MKSIKRSRRAILLFLDLYFLFLVPAFGSETTFKELSNVLTREKGKIVGSFSPMLEASGLEFYVREGNSYIFFYFKSRFF